MLEGGSATAFTGDSIGRACEQMWNWGHTRLWIQILLLIQQNYCLTGNSFFVGFWYPWAQYCWGVCCGRLARRLARPRKTWERTTTLLRLVQPPSTLVLVLLLSLANRIPPHLSNPIIQIQQRNVSSSAQLVVQPSLSLSSVGGIVFQVLGFLFPSGEQRSISY